MKKNRIDIVVIMIVLIILCFIVGIKGKLTGSDDKAKQAIMEQSVGYKPWFNNIWTPPSDFAEGILFVGQGIAGVAFIAYYIRKKKKCSK